MSGLKGVLVVLSLIGFAAAAHAESVLPTVQPESVGLSAAQLKRIEEADRKSVV